MDDAAPPDDARSIASVVQSGTVTVIERNSPQRHRGRREDDVKGPNHALGEALQFAGPDRNVVGFSAIRDLIVVPPAATRRSCSPNGFVVAKRLEYGDSSPLWNDCAADCRR